MKRLSSKSITHQKCNKNSLPNIGEKHRKYHHCIMNGHPKQNPQVSHKTLSQQFWALIPSPKFSKESMRQYKLPQLPSQEKHHLRQNTGLSNDGIDPTMTILQKYFSRKFQFRLKNVIKPAYDGSTNNNGSIGYQRVTIYKNQFKSKAKYQQIETISHDAQIKIIKDSLTRQLQRSQKRKKRNKSLQRSNEHLRTKASIIDTYFENEI